MTRIERVNTDKRAHLTNLYTYICDANKALDLSQLVFEIVFLQTSISFQWI